MSIGHDVFEIVRLSDGLRDAVFVVAGSDYIPPEGWAIARHIGYLTTEESGGLGGLSGAVDAAWLSGLTSKD